MFIAVLKKVFCFFEAKFSGCCGEVNTCTINQNIDTEYSVLASDFNTSVKAFVIRDNKELKFLPINIGEKFLNLKEFGVVRCGLTVVSSHYFKDMRNLQDVDLDGNKIETIEAGAFKDLVNVKGLYLSHNIIRTLDENLFATMVNLDCLDLRFNKIKFLGPNTFIIPGGKLTDVDLSRNVCINGGYRNYGSLGLSQLKSDIEAHCSEDLQN